MIEGKFFIKNFFLDKDIHKILDIGPGSGNYYDLFTGQGEYEHKVKLHVEDWSAIEIWGPYIDFFHLTGKYNHIYVQDVYDTDWDKLGSFDIIIFGDVIEHMAFNRAKEAIQKASNHAKWLVLSLPIINYPQEPSYGNIYEAHVEQYSPERVKELLEGFEILAQEEGSVIGAYIFRKP